MRAYPSIKRCELWIYRCRMFQQEGSLRASLICGEFSKCLRAKACVCMCVLLENMSGGSVRVLKRWNLKQMRVSKFSSLVTTQTRHQNNCPTHPSPQEFHTHVWVPVCGQSCSSQTTVSQMCKNIHEEMVFLLLVLFLTGSTHKECPWRVWGAFTLHHVS